MGEAVWKPETIESRMGNQVERRGEEL